MSILTVEHLSHGFGDRAIFEDVSFRLLKGEHIGFIGANGEGKSTFMSIVTHRLQPDEGKIEWSKNVRAGYLDQHAVLAPGMTLSRLHLTGDSLWQLPEGIEMDRLSGLRVLRTGLLLAHMEGKRAEPDHALAMALFTVIYMLRDTWVTFMRSVGSMYKADVAAMMIGKVRTALSFPGAGWVYVYLAFHRMFPDSWSVPWLISCYAVEGVLILLTFWSLGVYTRVYWPYLKMAMVRF